MNKESQVYQAYLRILKKELVPAMGCTEPIAISYAASYAKTFMEQDEIEAIDVYASGNIIKNVKSVIVPNSDGRKGIEVAAALGAYAGDASKELECIAYISEEKKIGFSSFLQHVKICVHHLKNSCALEVVVVLKGKKHTVSVKIADKHSNIVEVIKDQETLFQTEYQQKQIPDADYALLTMKDIYTFACCADLSDVKEILDRQICYNYAIAQKGLQEGYGANIAKVLLHTYGERVEVKAKAMAAAGSDARMSGCELPVIINSGSGNQGMSASIPVIVYAKEYQKDDETLYRALLVSNLVTLYQKRFIGRLSAYCGAVSAGAGAGAGICYLLGGDYDAICHTVVNALAITSGIICDGAKPSCAAKIASAVDAGILGYQMYQQGNQFYRGEGIVADSIERTIENVGELAVRGMKETDETIIKMMITS